MTGVEVAVGYLLAWVVRKARRVAGAADAEVDRVLDAGLEKVHNLVSDRLGDDPALARLEEEAAGGRQPRELTVRRVTLALQDAVEQDPVFAGELQRALDRLAAAAGGEGVSASGFGVAVGGSQTVVADGSSVAAGGSIVGGVSLGNPSVPGPPKV